MEELGIFCFCHTVRSLSNNVVTVESSQRAQYWFNFHQ